MQKNIVNPWTWQDKRGFVQANEISDANRVIFISGQTSVDDNGNIVHIGDMRSQLEQSLNNLESVLRHAGMDLADIVHMNIYTTDIRALMQEEDYFKNRLTNAGCRHAGTLLGVTALAFTGLMVAIEATAAA